MSTDISIDTRTASGIGGASPPDWAKPSRSGGRHSSFLALDLEGRPLGIEAKNAIKEVSPGVFGIELTQGKVALVDRANIDAIAEHRWCAWRNWCTFYALTTIHLPDGSRTTLRMHQLLIPGTEHVDHVNGDGLDNRRANLRAASTAENAHNQRKPRNNTSGFKGVYFDKIKGKWKARIMIDGRQISLGYHFDPETAASAYDSAAREHHGAFATLNFPEPGEQGAAR
jgi:hypothetical protein